jgi:c-di-GMP-binding flagellar brake protein YcgR
MDQQQTNVEIAQSEGGIERRQHERRGLRTPAVLALAGRKPVEVLALDISVGGVGTLCPINVKPGTACRIYLNLPISTHERELVSLEGVVMRSIFASKEDSFRVGLKFTDPTERQQVLIQRFVGT